MTREDRKKHGNNLKKQMANLAAKLGKEERLKLKLDLMGRGYGETTARLLIDGEYDRNPGRDLIADMEGTLARFGKAKAS